MNQIVSDLPSPYQKASVDTANGTSALVQFAISPQKLARLNLGLFRQLQALGTCRERICDALGLSAEEYNYVLRLT